MIPCSTTYRKAPKPPNPTERPARRSSKDKEPNDLTVTGDWSVVANDKAAGTETLETARSKIQVEPFSLVIAHTDGADQLEVNR